MRGLAPLHLVFLLLCLLLGLLLAPREVLLDLLLVLLTLLVRALEHPRRYVPASEAERERGAERDRTSSSV